MNQRSVYLAVGIGGMVGAVSRYGVSAIIPSVHGFPYATLFTNLLGCFLLSFLLNHAALKLKLSKKMLLAVGTGAIGSFTTFSTFMIETVTLYNSAEVITALAYIGISVIGGVLFCFLGYRAATGMGDQS
ncbi:fluoride efflux transporter CrcB [Virgibacillus flavescens]|uniref:fluoride efflux transporter CrcB n=1 Tax=Virgibacillus flavescens TaxID=1611422 RepID=UPI003D32E844